MGIIVAAMAALGAAAAALFAGLSYSSAQEANAQLKPSTGGFTAPAELTTTKCSVRAGHEGLNVTGTAHTEHNEDLWLLVRSSGEPKFWITSGTPIQPDPNGVWSHDTGTLGRKPPKDVNVEYKLLVVSADYNGSAQLQAGYQKPGPGYLKSLPPSVHVLQEACITRN